jgi:hypothetical protein
MKTRSKWRVFNGPFTANGAAILDFNHRIVCVIEASDISEQAARLFADLLTKEEAVYKELSVDGDGPVERVEFNANASKT